MSGTDPYDEQARAERSRLQNILDSLPFQILVTGTDYAIQTANRTYIESHDLRLSEVVGRHNAELERRMGKPDPGGGDGTTEDAVLKAGRRVSNVESRVDAEGREYFESIRTVPLRDDTGRVVGILESSLDITERVQTEEKLKRTRARLNQFIDTAPLLIYMLDRNLRIRVINRRAVEVLAIRESEVLGRRSAALFPEPSGKRFRALEREVGRTGTTQRRQGVMRIGDQDVHYAAALYPVLEDAEVVGMFCVIEDTTERVERERTLAKRSAQLSETRQELQGILENSRDPIFLTDATGRITSFSHGAESVLGYETDEVVGIPVHTLFQDPDELRALFDQALFEGHATLYEMDLRRKDGESATCNVSLTTVDDESGKTHEVVGICRDMTTRIRLRENLVRSERLAAIGKMAAGVAHEINNPLAVIESIAGVVEDTLEEEGGALQEGSRKILTRAVDRLRHQVRRCSSVTHGLLGFARKSGSEREVLDLVRLLEDCLGLLTVETKLIGARIEREYAPDLPRIETDPMLLQQVFVNLIKNACDAIEETGRGGGVITLRLSTRDRSMIVEIGDDGVGIEPGAMDKIFDLFHTSKPVGKGTGLGLAIVHDIVVRLGGEIDVESERGEWTKFRLSLPLPSAAEA